MGNKDEKRKKPRIQYPACSYQVLTKPKKQKLNKSANFTVLEVLRHVKTTCNCHRFCSHFMSDNCEYWALTCLSTSSMVKFADLFDPWLCQHLIATCWIVYIRFLILFFFSIYSPCISQVIILKKLFYPSKKHVIHHTMQQYLYSRNDSGKWAQPKNTYFHKSFMIFDRICQV